MPVLIILGAAGLMVGATYLVPLIISCVVGAVTIVVTFVSTRAYYKNKSANEAEMQNLKKEQAKRDAAVRDEVSRIAKETGVDIQALLNLSKEQQAELKNAIHSFMQNIEETDAASQNLSSIASSIQAASAQANIQQSDLYQELEQMKVELTNVHQKLSNTEKALANKEAELQQTITSLVDLGDKINASGILEKLAKLEELDGNEPPSESIDLNIQRDAAKDAELLTLRAKNNSLSETIEYLNETIADLQSKLKNSTQMEKLQIQEIQALISENKRITKTIESLTENMEENNSKAAQLTTNTAHQLRLFR